jgi:hypothetical protein
MKTYIKLTFLSLLLIAVSVVFIASRKKDNMSLLSLKNVEALADGETGWEECVEMRGFCVNSLNGTIYSYFLNTLE